MVHHTWSIEVMDVMGNVIHYAAHMCSIQEKYFGEEKESTARSAAAGCAGSHMPGAPLPSRLLQGTEQAAGHKPRQNLIDLSTHISRPGRIGVSPDIATSGLEESEALPGRFTAWLLVELMHTKYGQLNCTPV